MNEEELVRRFEENPCQIEDFFEREEVPTRMRLELYDVLRNIRLLHGATKALRELHSQKPCLGQGDIISFDPGVNVLTAIGGHFRADLPDGRVLRLSKVVLKFPTDAPANEYRFQVILQ